MRKTTYTLKYILDFNNAPEPSDTIWENNLTLIETHYNANSQTVMTIDHTYTDWETIWTTGIDKTEASKDEFIERLSEDPRVRDIVITQSHSYEWETIGSTNTIKKDNSKSLDLFIQRLISGKDFTHNGIDHSKNTCPHCSKKQKLSDIVI